MYNKDLPSGELYNNVIRGDVMLLLFATAAERNAVLGDHCPAGCEILVSGVGPVDTAVALAYRLAQGGVNAVLQMGIAGAYPDSGLTVGSVVRVERELLLELGHDESDGTFVPWERPQMGGQREFVVNAPANYLDGVGVRSGLWLALPAVRSATVARCTGTVEVAKWRSQWAQIENMEGAGALAAGFRAGVPVFEVRAISNWASSRDVSAWRITDALNALRDWWRGAFMGITDSGSGGGR